MWVIRRIEDDGDIGSVVDLRVERICDVFCVAGVLSGGVLDCNVSGVGWVARCGPGSETGIEAATGSECSCVHLHLQMPFVLEPVTDVDHECHERDGGQHEGGDDDE